MQLKHIPTSRKWFFASLVLFILFGVYTAIFITGIFLYPTLHIEQWLLHRPLTSVDCVFDEWKQVGEVGPTFFLTVVLGIVCIALGYRKRMLPLLILLLLLGVGIEYEGKQYFPQVIPVNVQFGLNSLSCPQLWQQPGSVKIMVGLGMWWKAPPVHPARVRNEQFSANAPLIFDDNAYIAYSYPSGHAMRWCFLGLIAAWLILRHLKSRWLRMLLVPVALAIALGGGFAQFYIGLHLPTDVLGGYLFGASAACSAIGLLSINGQRHRDAMHSNQAHAVDEATPSDESDTINTVPEELTSS